MYYAHNCIHREDKARLILIRSWDGKALASWLTPLYATVDNAVYFKKLEKIGLCLQVEKKIKVQNWEVLR